MAKGNCPAGGNHIPGPRHPSDGKRGIFNRCRKCGAPNV